MSGIPVQWQALSLCSLGSKNYNCSCCSWALPCPTPTPLLWGLEVYGRCVHTREDFCLGVTPGLLGSLAAVPVSLSALFYKTPIPHV